MVVFIRAFRFKHSITVKIVFLFIVPSSIRLVFEEEVAVRDVEAEWFAFVVEDFLVVFEPWVGLIVSFHLVVFDFLID